MARIDREQYGTEYNFAVTSGKKGTRLFEPALISPNGVDLETLNAEQLEEYDRTQSSGRNPSSKPLVRDHFGKIIGNVPNKSDWKDPVASQNFLTSFDKRFKNQEVI